MKYYVHFNGAAWFVKEAKFFEKQGGLREPWGKAWESIEADSIEHARCKAELEQLRNEKFAGRDVDFG